MSKVYFSQLPRNVARSAFRDTISKYVLQNTGADGPQPTLTLEIPDKPTAEFKHYGSGAIEFTDDITLQEFLAKLKMEPIMFKTEIVVFSRNPPSTSQSSRSSETPAHADPVRKPQSEQLYAPSDDGCSTTGSAKHKMNLNKSKLKPRVEKTGPRPDNPRDERRLQHRLSALGQRARLECIEFGVLRNQNFSIEYSRPVLEEGGDFVFEDNEKSLRITIGGTHKDPVMPSIAISIQTVNYVALGFDFGTPYMFLELSQNPHFELGNTARRSSGNAQEDAHFSRSRHSALDPIHRRVAPFASRWLKLSFYADSFYPDSELCLLAGLPPPDINPLLTFDKQDLYSRRNIDVLEKWLQGDSLPWEVAFQCEALFRNGTLVPPELLAIRPIVEKLVRESSTKAYDALKTFREKFEGADARRTFNDFKHQSIVEAFEKHVNNNAKLVPLDRLQKGKSKSNFMCHHVKVTPTAVFLAGPLAEQSNRVIRRYPGYESHFIRVSFTDEGDGRSRFDFEVDTNAFSEARIGRFLKNELQIGNRKFELLGYSQSGFRDHACFFSSNFEFGDQIVTPESIRLTLGNFEKVIDCPARYGARMSQAFSSTDPSITLSESVIKQIPDLITRKSNLEFSDGCGTISRDLAEEVWKGMIDQMPHTRRRQRHRAEPTPCAFQIRIGGSKGMVRMDPKLEGRVLCLRPSMTKFEAPGELALEIARAFERPSPCFLNRPLIMLMWTGGVETEVFERLMSDTLESTISGMKTFDGISKQLITNRLGRPFRLADTFHKLSYLGLKLDQPGVRTVGLHKILNASLYHIKMGLKHKARIPVPRSHTLVGVCDEDDYLLPRQIYACVQHFDHKTGKIDKQFLWGRMLVTRSPVIHPGDAQILYGIGSPPPDSPFAGEGNHLPNCVVFSSRGFRPVPNMLGGGDLDGDLYNLIPVPELIPPHIYTPASYPAAKLNRIDRPSTIDDLADFMINFICNDALGMISINHLIIASSSELRARDENCMINARLHSKAVDFVKTGYHVANHEIKKPKYDIHVDKATGMGLRPDWQAGHGRDPADGHYYECPSVLGRLFRAVDLPRGNPARTPVDAPREPRAVQKCLAGHVAVYGMQIKGTFEQAIPWVQALLLRYIAELNHICVSHTVSSETSERVSEVEVMLGTNLETASGGSHLLERMKRLTDSLADFVRLELQGGESDLPYDWLARAWRAYLHTSNLGDETFGALSFSWIALGSVLEALQALNEKFLPNLGPIIPPIPVPPTGPSSGSDINLDEFAQVDLVNWVWDDGPKADGTKEVDSNTQESSGFSQNGSGYNQGNGGNIGRGQKGGRGGYTNGGGNGGRGRGSGRGSARGSHNGNDSRSQTSATRGPSRTRVFSYVES